MMPGHVRVNELPFDSAFERRFRDQYGHDITVTCRRIGFKLAPG
jgi:hypothetical protein